MHRLSHRTRGVEAFGVFEVDPDVPWLQMGGHEVEQVDIIATGRPADAAPRAMEIVLRPLEWAWADAADRDA